jgi:hypothetical protein
MKKTATRSTPIPTLRRRITFARPISRRIMNLADNAGAREGAAWSWPAETCTRADERGRAGPELRVLLAQAPLADLEILLLDSPPTISTSTRSAGSRAC